MIRTLLIVTAASIALCLASAATFVALGGIQAIQHGDFAFNDGDWESRGHRGRHDDRYGPRAERTLNWAGGDSLTFDLSAEVVYTQAAAASITVSGPKSLVDRVTMEDGRIGIADTDDGQHRVRHWRRGHSRLLITISAPAVKDFTINGSADLKIKGYDQPDLAITIHGSGDVDGYGKTQALKLAIAGSGDADLQGLTANSAKVRIAGSGDAIVDAIEAADVAIAGSGDVRLTRRPPALTSDIAGSGDLDIDQ